MSDYNGVPIADILQVGGLKEDLTCDIWHPVNAVYRKPLPKDGDVAVSMADAMAGSVIDTVAAAHADDPRFFDPEKVFEECLVDARRMVCEPDYGRLFGGDGAASLEDIMRARRRSA